MYKYKWWRFYNIQMPNAVSFGQIRFTAKTGEESLNPLKASARTTYLTGNRYAVGNAFNGINSGNFYHNNGPIPLEWIAYEFDYPVEVVSVTISARWDGSGQGQELQETDVQVSQDGVEWEPYAHIAPKMPGSRPTLTIPIPRPVYAKDLNTFYKPSLSLFELSAPTGDGILSGKVTEGAQNEEKIPVRTEVMLHDRRSKKLVQITYSDHKGFFTFKNLDPSREYYALSLHPEKEFNSVITDILILN